MYLNRFMAAMMYLFLGFFYYSNIDLQIFIQQLALNSGQIGFTE